MRGRGFHLVVAVITVAVLMAAGRAPAGAASSNWTVVQTSATQGFNAVSCSNDASCVLVGSSESETAVAESAIAHWDGAHWAFVAGPTLGSADDSYQGVSCVSATNCVAVGYSHNLAFLPRRQVVERWNGSTWTADVVPHPGSTEEGLGGVSCTTSSDCHAVGYFDAADGSTHPLIERWDGAHWSIESSVDPPEGGQLTSVSCVGATMCVAVGTSLIERWNGATWALNTGATFSDPDPALISVSCGSASSCAAVGQDVLSPSGSSIIEHWDGTAWSADAGATGSGFDTSGYTLTGVACPSASRCVAVGGGGTLFPLDYHQAIDTWDGTAWSADPAPSSPTNSGLGAVSCFGVGACLTTGATYLSVPAPHIEPLLETDLPSVSGVPGAPRSVRAALVGSTISVSWPAPNDNGAAITSYSVGISPGPRTETVLGPHANFAGLLPGTYRFRVRAANAFGIGSWSPLSNPVTIVKRQSITRRGYWMLGSDGKVYPFGNAPRLGSAGSRAVAIAPRSDGNGYWVTDTRGDVSHFGSATDHGGRPSLRSGEFVTTISATPSGQGYWLFSNRGRAFAYGNAHFYGDMSGTQLNGGIVASVATATGRGYYMIGSDGGVFNFGDARFHGSTGNLRLSRPVVGISPTLDNRGYWLVASDGGVFAFTAPFRGSMGAAHLNRPVNGLVAYGNGYLMVSSDGGVFDFSNTAFLGSLAANPPTAPIVGIAAFTAH